MTIRKQFCRYKSIVAQDPGKFKPNKIQARGEEYASMITCFYSHLGNGLNIDMNKEMGLHIHSANLFSHKNET